MATGAFVLGAPGLSPHVSVVIPMPSEPPHAVAEPDDKR
jgi:hypothetical protein